MNNAIMELTLYKQGKTWKFDDIKHKIIAEPFVLGMSEMIDHYVNDKKSKNTVITFSKNKFPGSNRLTLLSEDANGGWYEDDKSKMRGWLCPVTRMYMTNIPKHIYFSVSPVQKSSLTKSILKKIKSLIKQ